MDKATVVGLGLVVVVIAVLLGEVRLFFTKSSEEFIARYGIKMQGLVLSTD